MLASQDDAALAGLTSAGLLRRAKAALEKPGAVETAVETADSAEVIVEGYRVEFGTDDRADSVITIRSLGPVTIIPTVASGG